MRYALAFAVLLAAGGVVRAEDVEVRGRARGTGDATRRAALDQAFVDAVTRAVADRVPPAARTGHEDAVRDQILHRARRFVRSFRVVDERDQGGQVEVHVFVAIDEALLADALGGLGLRAAALPPAPAPDAGNKPRVLLVLKATIGSTTRATFGDDAGDGGVAGRVLLDELAALGLAAVPAGAIAIPVAGESGEEGELAPLDDAQAAAIGRAAGAAAVAVVGLKIDPTGPIRSTALSGAVARGAIRIVAGDDTIGHAEIDLGGFGADPDAALAEAARQAVRGLIGGVSGEIAKRWPTGVRGSDPVTVTIRGQSGWGPVAAVIRKLGTMAGVDGVAVRQARAGLVQLGLATALGGARLAAALRELKLPSGQLAARPRGEGAVEIEVSGDAPLAPGSLDAPAPGIE